MRVLITEGNPDLGRLWCRHLERRGCEVILTHSQHDAVHAIRNNDVDVIVLNLVLQEGSAFAIADFASYRSPKARIIFVTDTSFFSDGSIFQHIPNACAMMGSQMPPEDLTALVEHYGTTH